MNISVKYWLVTAYVDGELMASYTATSIAEANRIGDKLAAIYGEYSVSAKAIYA